MLSSKKVSLCDRYEIGVNSEMRSVLRSQGKQLKELYDDYKVTLAKRQLAQTGLKKENFAVRVQGGGSTARISLTQCTAKQSTQNVSPDSKVNKHNSSSKANSQIDKKTKSSIGSPREP